MPCHWPLVDCGFVVDVAVVVGVAGAPLYDSHAICLWCVSNRLDQLKVMNLARLMVYSHLRRNPEIQSEYTVRDTHRYSEPSTSQLCCIEHFTL